MPTETAPAESKPVILDKLPNVPIHTTGCPRRTRLDIDLILLALEALSLGGAEEMLSVAKELELDSIIQHRVGFWVLRNTNPLRRATQRRELTEVEAKALVAIACHLARRLTVKIRQLLLEVDLIRQRGKTVEPESPLGEYLERFGVHFRSRMNPRRSTVVAYSSDDKLNALALDLLAKLLFCTGTAGMSRFWISLFDGEVES
jgi:Protein of unknown function (DUF3038)